MRKLRREKYEKVLESLDNVDYVSGSARFRSNREAVVNGEEVRFKKPSSQRGQGRGFCL